MFMSLGYQRLRADVPVPHDNGFYEERCEEYPPAILYILYFTHLIKLFMKNLKKTQLGKDRVAITDIVVLYLQL